MQTFERSPVPYFAVDRNFGILSCSESSLEAFPAVGNFLELVDEESRSKATEWLHPSRGGRASVELNMTSRKRPISLFEVYVEWDGVDRGNVLCVERQDRMNEIGAAVEALRRQLADFDFHSLDRQEQLERELELLREAARRSDKVDVIGELAAGIAHEIRNPLTSVRGFVQLLRPYLEGIGKGNYAEIVLADINRANDIINLLINTSRPSAPMRRTVSATQLIRGAISDVSEAADEAGCELRFRPPAATLSLYVDVPQVRQALANVLRNGVDAVAASANAGRGYVEVEAFQEEDGVRILVRDTGIGMDQHTITRAFVPFFTTKDGTLGLGLAMSCRIVENHGGTIGIDSRLGKGSTITINLFDNT
jgi:signal transduction histidine kinase